DQNAPLLAPLQLGHIDHAQPNLNDLADLPGRGRAFPASRFNVNDQNAIEELGHAAILDASGAQGASSGKRSVKSGMGGAGANRLPFAPPPTPRRRLKSSG